ASETPSVEIPHRETGDKVFGSRAAARSVCVLLRRIGCFIDISDFTMGDINKTHGDDGAAAGATFPVAIFLVVKSGVDDMNVGTIFESRDATFFEDIFPMRDMHGMSSWESDPIHETPMESDEESDDERFDEDDNEAPTRKNERAAWNSHLEKSLVDLLHEHNTARYRGQIGWSSEAWSKILKEFHERNMYVSYTKSQIKEKEKELKRQYKMLKDARMQSGVGWNDTRSMLEAEDALWDNLVISFPKIKKFKTKSFPLFDALGELYDGQIAEGTYNVSSTQPPQHRDLTQVDNRDELSHIECTFPGLEESWAYNVQEDANLRDHITIDDEDESVARTLQRINKRPPTTTRNKEEKESKKTKKQSSNDIAGSMERYIFMREKQIEIESAQLASKNKVAQAGDYSIKRCISEMMTMALSTDEKVTAADVFKDPDNREIFLSTKEDDPRVALLWLRKAVAKLSQVV
ncbi:hypothetical protein QYE76_008303, partial [Lolium multiflorum]